MLEATDEEIVEWMLVELLADEEEAAAHDPIAAIQRALRDHREGVERFLDAVRKAPLPERAAAPSPGSGPAETLPPYRLARTPRAPVRP